MVLKGYPRLSETFIAQEILGLQQAGLLENRLVREAGGDAAARIRMAFELCYGRDPDPAEAVESEALIRKHGLGVFCRALFNSNEFVYLR